MADRQVKTASSYNWIEYKVNYKKTLTITKLVGKTQEDVAGLGGLLFTVYPWKR